MFGKGAGSRVFASGLRAGVSSRSLQMKSPPVRKIKLCHVQQCERSRNLRGQTLTFEKTVASRVRRATASRLEGVISKLTLATPLTSAPKSGSPFCCPRSARRSSIGLRAAVGSRLPAFSREARMDRVRYHAENLVHDRCANKRRGAARIKRWRHFDDIAANQTEAL